jgi:uncharacterized protein YjiK
MEFLGMKLIVVLSVLLCSFTAYSKPSISLHKKIILPIKEPSALSFSNDYKSLWTVSDNNGSIYSLSLEGLVLGEIKTTASDLEGVVAHKDLSALGSLCVVLERDREVQCFDQKGKISRKQKIPFAGVKNAGFEGITFNSDNQRFYIVNEKSPSAILELSIDFEILNTHTVNFAKDLSDIFYDSHEKKMWVISHESKKLYQLTSNFEIEMEFDLSDVVQAEGVVVDSLNKKIYVVSDKDSAFYIYNYVN